MDMLQYKLARVLVEELGKCLEHWLSYQPETKSECIIEAIFDYEHPGQTLITDYVFDINRDVELICLSLHFYPAKGLEWSCRLVITDGLHYTVFGEGDEVKHDNWKVTISTMAQMLKDRLVDELGFVANPDDDGGYSDFKYFLPKV